VPEARRELDVQAVGGQYGRQDLALRAPGASCTLLPPPPPPSSSSLLLSLSLLLLLMLMMSLLL
jgi:hypothetical protein